jgi:C_GCAxxG_C_C family probable redox protein
MKIASGFAKGMLMGETCGAVTGAIMVLGLRHGGADCEAARGRKKVYAAVKEFVSRFEKRAGSVICRDLLGQDAIASGGTRAPQGRAQFKTRCPKAVLDAAEILEEMLQDN